MVAQQGLTVVLADDDPMFRVVLADALQRRGCRVYACENGMTALYYLRTLKEAVHLVVTDLMMPGIDGNELARLASAERPTSKVIRYTDVKQRRKNSNIASLPGQKQTYPCLISAR